MSNVLGRISSVRIGNCGYQDIGFGVEFRFSLGSSTVCDTWVAWYPASHSMKGEVFEKLRLIMKDARVTDIRQLVGTPVEVQLSESNALITWRILTEVL